MSSKEQIVEAIIRCLATSKPNHACLKQLRHNLAEYAPNSRQNRLRRVTDRMREYLMDCEDPVEDTPEWLELSKEIARLHVAHPGSPVDVEAIYVVFQAYYKHGNHATVRIQGERNMRDYLQSYFFENDDVMKRDVRKMYLGELEEMSLKDMIKLAIRLGEAIIESDRGYGIASVVEVLPDGTVSVETELNYEEYSGPS